MNKRIMTLFLVFGLLFALALTGCAPAAEPATEEPAAEKPAEEEKAAAPTPEESAGFEEFPIGDEVDLEPYLHVAGVYFQPVVMEPAELGLSKDESNMHIEADISALEGNNLGFGAGDWVPFLTVNYEIKEKDSGEVVNEGTFMPMSASDGPHYGANILLEDAGSYVVKFIIESPASNGYVLHVDKETGVDGRFWDKPLEVEWDFDYVPTEW